MKNYLLSITMAIMTLLTFSVFASAASPLEMTNYKSWYLFNNLALVADQPAIPAVAWTFTDRSITVTGEITRAEYNLTVKSAQYRSVNAVARANVPYEVGWRGDC